MSVMSFVGGTLLLIAKITKEAKNNKLLREKREIIALVMTLEGIRSQIEDYVLLLDSLPESLRIQLQNIHNQVIYAERTIDELNKVLSSFWRSLGIGSAGILQKIEAVERQLGHSQRQFSSVLGNYSIFSQIREISTRAFVLKHFTHRSRCRTFEKNDFVDALRVEFRCFDRRTLYLLWDEWIDIDGRGRIGISDLNKFVEPWEDFKSAISTRYKDTLKLLRVCLLLPKKQRLDKVALWSPVEKYTRPCSMQRSNAFHRRRHSAPAIPRVEVDCCERSRDLEHLPSVRSHTKDKDVGERRLRWVFNEDWDLCETSDQAWETSSFDSENVGSDFSVTTRSCCYESESDHRTKWSEGSTDEGCTDDGLPELMMLQKKRASFEERSQEIGCIT